MSVVATHVHYSGLMKVVEAFDAAIMGLDVAKATEYSDHGLCSSPIMRTSAPEQEWIESSARVAEGRWSVKGKDVAIEYEFIE